MITSIAITIPDPMYSDYQYARFYHLDVSHLSDEELKSELWSYRSLLYWLPPRHWIRDRERELGKEYGKRFYQRTTQPSTPSSSKKLIKTVEL